MVALKAVAPTPEQEGAGAREGTWPHQLSHDPELRVSDVLEQLSHEFPALSSSKLRFLDSNGLVTPHRSGAGYRQYSAADVERLRFVLTRQRDEYLPLSAIAEQLGDLDAGRVHHPVGPRAVGESASTLTPIALAHAATVDVDIVEQLAAAGLIEQTGPGRYGPEAVPLVIAGAAYLGSGGDPRSLATLARAARREAELATDAARPRRARGDDATADTLERARADAAVALFSACVHDRIGR
ncbi:MerR family transcriptional regulator [uncultured Demequina sp.]|uniref:transcriptional regulator FtsR n=1 Tax=uncultured Demequina sp. TaxID=693499 RepID=UPI0025D3B0B1|nr:MerR family transcriptional regulator [uncultured Demequina sp.]